MTKVDIIMMIIRDMGIIIMMAIKNTIKDTTTQKNIVIIMTKMVMAIVAAGSKT